MSPSIQRAVTSGSWVLICERGKLNPWTYEGGSLQQNNPNIVPSGLERVGRMRYHFLDEQQLRRRCLLPPIEGSHDDANVTGHTVRNARGSSEDQVRMNQSSSAEMTQSEVVEVVVFEFAQRYHVRSVVPLGIRASDQPGLSGTLCLLVVIVLDTRFGG